MKIFLHIGMPKTGSTSIQRTLLLNQSRLAAEGVYYPYRSDFLYGLATGTEAGPPLTPPSNCHTLIISDERLFNKVRSPDDAQRVVDALKTISPKVRLVSYVRREDEVFVSAYFTRLLMGSAQKLEDLPLNPVQIYKRLSSWEKPLGRKNMIVRRFGRPYLPDGLLADFAEIVGIHPFAIEEGPVANWSPRCDVLEIIRLLNADRGYRELDRAALKAVARVDGFGDPVGMSEEKRVKLIEKAREQNRKLSERYFGGEQVFSHPVMDNEPRWPEIDTDDVVRVADHMAAAYGVPTGRRPADLGEALEWIRALSVACTRVPKRLIGAASERRAARNSSTAARRLRKAAIG
jgi:hypothetical protein